MWVVLQPKVCLRERYWDMRPSCSEASAFTHMRDSSEVFFACLFVSNTGSFDPPEMALMMLTLLPEGALLAHSGICPGSSFGGGGKLIGS